MLANFLLPFICPVLMAATTPLFEKGPETFSVKNKDGKTPSFRVLDKSASEKAVATAILAALGQPSADHVDILIEELYFAPAKLAGQLDLSVKVNGKYLIAPDPVDRAKFLTGQMIEIKFPEKEKDAAIFKVKSSGEVKLKLDPVKLIIQIENATAQIHYSSSFLGDGDQALKFTGTAVRKL